MSSTAIRVFCLVIVCGLPSPWPALSHPLTTQKPVSCSVLTPNQARSDRNIILCSSKLFEQQQEKRALQQQQWQQQQEQWRDRQDLKFQQQYLQQLQELEHQQEIRLRAK